MAIEHTCQCAKSFRAKLSMASKDFQCISCNRTISIPALTTAGQVKSDFLAPQQPSSAMENLFDKNIPDLGIPTATQVSYHPPQTQPTYKSNESQKKASEQSAPQNSGITINFNQDGLSCKLKNEFFQKRLAIIGNKDLAMSMRSQLKRIITKNPSES